jgi:hypothetical protein
MNTAIRSIAVASATIYEAEIAASRILGSMQRDKALQAHGAAFIVKSNQASAVDFVHPSLYEIAMASAANLENNSKRKVPSAKAAAS